MATAEDAGEKDRLRDKYKLFAATFIAIVLSAVISTSCFVVGPDWRAGMVSLLIAFLGMVIGWIVGVAITPYSDSEKRQFSIYSKAVGVFASGYVLAKLDRMIEYIFTPDNIFSLGADDGFRVLVFSVSALIALITVFTHRQYVEQDKLSRGRVQVELTKKVAVELPEHDPAGEATPALNQARDGTGTPSMVEVQVPRANRN